MDKSVFIGDYLDYLKTKNATQWAFFIVFHFEEGNVCNIFILESPSTKNITIYYRMMLHFLQGFNVCTRLISAACLFSYKHTLYNCFVFL